MPDIEFTTKGAEKVVADQDRIGKSAQKNYKLTKKEAEDLGRVEQKILRDTETARERYNRKLAESRKALAGHAREVELLKRVETQLKIEYMRSADANSKLAAKRKKDAHDAQAEQKRLAAEVKKTAAEVEKAGQKLTGFADPKKLAGAIAGFVGVHAIVAKITEELRAQQTMVDKRNQTQLSVSESRNSVLRNMIGESDGNIKTVQSATQRISASTGVSEVAINNAMADTLSATNTNVPLSISLVEQSAKFLKDKPGDIGSFAGSLGDLTRITGSTDPNVALGLLAKVGAQSRITSPELTAKNAAPALLGTMPFGGTAQSAGALFSALTSGSGDVTGERSGTATISLAQQLAEFDLGTGKLGKGNDAQQAKLSSAREKVESVKQRLADFDEKELLRKEKQAEATKNFDLDQSEAAEEDDRFSPRERKKRLRERAEAKARQGFDANSANARAQLDRQHITRDITGAEGEVTGIENEIAGATPGGQALKAQYAKYQKMGLMERIRFMQSNPEMAKQFLSDASFERKAVGPITQLLTDPNSAVQRDFNKNAADIGNNGQLAGLGKGALDIFSRNSLEPVAERGRTIGTLLEQLQVRGNQEHVSSKELEEIRGVMLETGGTNLAASLDESISRAKNFGPVKTTDVISQLETRAKQLESPNQNAYGSELGSISGDELPNQASDEEKEQAKLLREAVEQLKQSVSEQKKTNQKLGSGDGFVVGAE